MRSIIVALCLASVTASAATILGFGAEVDYYTPTASGDFNYKTTQTHFGSDQESGYQVGIYFEHPAPLIPNLRVDLTPEISYSGLDGAAVSKVSLDQVDITPYYEIMDNIIDLDIGMTFKVLEGKIEGTDNQSFKEVIPMGYLGIAITPPLSPLSLEGSVKYIEYSGDSLTDARIKACWKIAQGFGAQAGYRYESLKISDHFNINADTTFKGPFVGLNYRF
ncbi:MAG: TIGR04219 family outer membrane beta-barrel protein [Sulfuricurvum sp.]|uniref:TIGR04219 family outer membrane beta-barrel protein n=1 Tax=Sulfuricurvum sp. TaxID=2025608 RepID=UPI00260B4B93|nr:TIGR04219 family outer membrane beta-barrel protein [Sulfuricurvum sp.]MDD2951394.1 TIGR04219 family outer membrane beta-barrel protein [Sulfuricurvum sp.]MDD5117685.1 TIGR04219 family outer membrane beta-barrel protein [Sulfuricurvum sp.]